MHAVFFDLDGTLLRIERHYAAIVAETCRAHLDTDADAVLTAHDEAFLEAFLTLASEPYHAAARAAIATAGVDASPDAMVETRRELEYDALVLPAEMGALLDDLSGHPLGVLTNGLPEWQRGKLAHVGLTDRFETVVTSYEAGAHKPDSRIFDLAAERLAADDYVMLGDDPEADVQGARAAGWNAIHVEGDVAADLRAVLDRE
jgi:HAD superfamily hydrolase (TIGR01549 family)